MKRTDFLKSLIAIPFVGSIVAKVIPVEADIKPCEVKLVLGPWSELIKYHLNENTIFPAEYNVSSLIIDFCASHKLTLVGHSCNSSYSGERFKMTIKQSNGLELKFSGVRYSGCNNVWSVYDDAEIQKFYCE